MDGTAGASDVNPDELAQLLESGRRPDGPGRPDEEAAAALHDLLRDPATWAEPPPGGAEAVLAAIRAEAPEPGPAGVRPMPDRPPGPAPAAAPGPPRRRRAVLAVAAAAVLVVVAGIAAVALRGTGGESEREVAIAGTDLAPGASAEATVQETDSGLDIVLDVSGLPPAEPGTYYQGWVRGPEGAVTIGTFHGRGETAVNLWAGVDLDRYPELTVTLQQEGGGAESSGQVVLRGRIAP